MATTQRLSDSDFIWPYVDPPVYDSYWFENFDVKKCKEWMERNWSISLYICAVYIISIVLGQLFMKNRPAYDLKKPLALWNLSMAVFSVLGFLRCLPELLYVLNGTNGFHRSICVRDSHNQASAFWAWAFTWSKVIELGDTFFIIFRKKQLMFIHYYHHSIALVVCFAYYSDYEPIARYFGICNFAVHTILYFYLFLKTVDVQLPRSLARFIIFIELAQMLMGIAVNSYALLVIKQGHPCARSLDGIHVQMGIYASFVFMFFYLFIVSETGPRKKKTS